MPNSPEPLLIEIFKPGAFTSAEGVKVSFTSEDLIGMAEAFDAATNPAPVVVGHPELDAPAYGWTDSLAFDGEKLVATCGQVEASFAELVGEGRYKRVSAQFYPKDHPNNPKPGSFYLKHIGFLGAHAPSVKGLKPVSFSEEDQAGCLTLEFSTAQEAELPKEKEGELSFAEQQAALDADRAKLDEERKELADAKAKAVHDNHVSFAETLVTAGKLRPADKDGIVFILDALAGTPATLSFGEGDKAQRPDAVFRKMLDSASPMVSFGEHAPSDSTQRDDTPHERGMKARALVNQAKSEGRVLSFTEAVAQLKAEGGA